MDDARDLMLARDLDHGVRAGDIDGFDQQPLAGLVPQKGRDAAGAEFGGDDIVARREQAADRMAADEAETAGYQDHCLPPYARLCRAVGRF